MRARPFAVVLALMIAAVPVWTAPVIAAPLEARLAVSADDGYGRLVLTFPERTLLPQYDAAISNGVLRVSFHEPVDVDISDVPVKLSDYISIARRDPDGSAIRFALARDFRINTMEAGERLFIDLLPRSWTGLPPGLPEEVVRELALRAEEAMKRVRALEQARLRGDVKPQVDLRIGTHPTFTRLSFHWNIAFDTAFVREGDVVKLVFNHDVPLDLSELHAHLPEGIADATAFSDENKLKVLLKMQPGVDVRAFREDGTYVVDLTPRRAAPDPVNAAIDAALQADGPVPAQGVIEAAAPAETDAPLDSEPRSTTAAVAVPQQKPQPSAATAPPAVAERPATATLPEAIDVTALARAPAPEPVPTPETPPAGYDEEVRRFVPAEVRRIGNTVRVVFPFAEPISAAVFRRHDSIWLVFDSADPIDVRGMRSVLAGDADEVTVTPGDGWQSIRVDLTRQSLATIGVDGSSWVLTIGDTILEPSRPLVIERSVRGDGGTVLSVPFQRPQHLREIADPFAGDRIMVVTAYGPARGLIKPQSFVELDALMSAHGLAVARKADDVKLTLDGDSIRIERPHGLHLSSRDLDSGARILPAIVDPSQPGQIDLGALMTHSPPDFQATVAELEYRIAHAPETQRRGLRMELSRFYLAHGFAQEALGLLRLVSEDDAAMMRDPTFNLMMGAAQVLAHRPKLALDYLGQQGLQNSPDAAVWQTIASAELKDWSTSRLMMSRGSAVIGNYPPAIQNEFKLAVARMLVEVNDFGQAARELSEIDPSLLSGVQAARYDVLRGRIADASGRSREALTVFELVERSDVRPQAAEAAYRALRIRHRDGEITDRQAIDALARLATGWRGDETELNTLRFLTQLYVQNGEYREAFEAMKSAVEADPESDVTRLMQDEMAGVFASLFLDGKADEMDPVKALALFYDFREMLPIGWRGDEMVRRLASRLVAMDLLDQASELLSHQVENRLRGAVRAQVAADLAVVHLMDRRPEEALRVLARTRQAKLPRSLEHQRNIVEARALTESGRPDLALDIVRNMRGIDVERLRADTFWAAQSWREAAEQLEAMVGSRWADKIPLDDRERSDILRAAIGYALANDQFSLDRLRTKFAAKMADSPQADAFEAVTQPADARGVEFMQVVESLDAVDSLDAFLAEYQRVYMRPDGSGSPYLADDGLMSTIPPTDAPAEAAVPDRTAALIGG